MIFVTVGEQLPFDRLIRTVDNWAKSSGKDVFAQIGRTNFKPSFIAYQATLDPAGFKEKIRSAEFIIAHAGMGTIITALELQKPIIIMPRKNSLGEIRNDHQFATARYFLSRGISVALDENELLEKLDNIDEIERSTNKVENVKPLTDLLMAIRDFIYSAD
ncbi:MAG: glycosyltransferase [Desulfobulbus sp.]|nr:glycosyltransferase [Desulfobulbus sp.]